MILITGASSGLGAALAKSYYNDGHDLMLTGRNELRLSEIADRLNALKNSASGKTVKIQPAELNDEVAIALLLEKLDGVPSQIVHCAGSGYFGAIENQNINEIRQLIDNNITSTILFLQAVIARYRDEKVRVVVVMSTAAQVAKAGESTYCAVKWAVKGFIESLRLELKGSAMNIVAVYPGGMNTEFWANSGSDLDTSKFMSADEAASMVQQALTSTEHGFVSDITVNRG